MVLSPAQLAKDKKIPRQLRPWLEVLAKVRQSNPNMPYKQQLKVAQQAYRRIK